MVSNINTESSLPSTSGQNKSGISPEGLSLPSKSISSSTIDGEGSAESTTDSKSDERVVPATVPEAQAGKSSDLPNALSQKSDDFGNIQEISRQSQSILEDGTTPGETRETSHSSVASDSTHQYDNREVSLENGVANLNISSSLPEELGTALDPADVPLPSVEGDEFPRELGSAPVHNQRSVSLTPSISIDAASDSVGSDRQERAMSLVGGIEDLRLESDNSRTPSEPGTPIMRGLGYSNPDPTTVRDLVNATPSPSPAPATNHQNQEPFAPVSPSTKSASSSLTGRLFQSQEHDVDLSESSSSPENLSEKDAAEEAAEQAALQTTMNRESYLPQVSPISDSVPSAEEEDSDSEDQMDDHDMNDVYDVRSELLPESPFSNRQFQESLKRVTDLAKDIHASLSQCELTNNSKTDVHRLYDSAAKLSKFDCPAERRIAIVGDSGAGRLLLGKQISKAC